MITVAVTGGIGSGKSTVSGALGDHGAVVVDSDQLARQVVAPGTPGLAAVADAFGTAMIGPDGALDRAALASVVFADPAARKTLEGITHPLVRARFAEIQRAAAPDAVVVNDIPLLTTLAAAATFHLVVGVRADPELRVQRLIGRGLAESDARARMAAQLTDEQRAPLCDVMLVNHGDRDELRAAVDGLWQDRLLPFAENTRAGRRADGRSPRLVDPQPRWTVDARRLAARVSRAAGGAPRRSHRVDRDPGDAGQGRHRPATHRAQPGRGRRAWRRPWRRPGFRGRSASTRTLRIRPVTTRPAGSSGCTPTPIRGRVSTST